MLDVQALLAGVDGCEWDDGNVSKNLLVHGVTPKEAEEVFLISPARVFRDERHSGDEQRYILLGHTAADRKRRVAFTIRATRVRVISVRDMSRKERRSL